MSVGVRKFCGIIILYAVSLYLWGLTNHSGSLILKMKEGKGSQMQTRITLETCRSYATEANLMKGLEKLGLNNFTMGEEGFMPCRYVVARTPDGRWTAIFLVSEFFNVNKTGGYVMFASYHGFMSV